MSALSTLLPLSLELVVRQLVVWGFIFQRPLSFFFLSLFCRCSARLVRTRTMVATRHRLSLFREVSCFLENGGKGREKVACFARLQRRRTRESPTLRCWATVKRAYDSVGTCRNTVSFLGSGGTFWKCEPPKEGPLRLGNHQPIAVSRVHPLLSFLAVADSLRSRLPPRRMVWTRFGHRNSG